MVVKVLELKLIADVGDTTTTYVCSSVIKSLILYHILLQHSYIYSNSLYIYLIVQNRLYGVCNINTYNICTYVD